MQIEYRTRQLELVCTNARVASRQYGDLMARRINLCIKQIRMAGKVDELLRLRLGRYHMLSGNRAGQYAMDLIRPMRFDFHSTGRGTSSL